MIPKNKKQLTEAIQLTYGKLQKDLLDIPEELTGLKQLEGHAKGTMMSVNDLVAYLIGWGELVLKWKEKKDNGEEIEFPETGFKWNELGLLAQKFYKDYEDQSYLQLMNKLDRVVKKILQVIEREGNKALYTEPWYGKYPLGRMIQLNTSSPYKNARARVRKWRKQC